MKASAFDYVRADSVAHAVELLAADPDGARVLAGGQSLGPMLNLRLARPSMLIDIKRVASLRGLDADDRMLRLGACWTHAEIEDGVVEDTTCGLLQSVARGIAYRAVRNRGTIGGSLAHADPAADWVTAMAVLGADVIVHGPGNAVRRCGADAFMRAGFATDLQRGEMIAAIEVPRLSPGARWGYYKVCRKRGEFATAIGAAVLDASVGIARVVCGATSGPPVLLPNAAARLAEVGPDGAMAVIADELSDLMAHADETVRQVYGVAVRRALRQLA
jgi:aerobic carbon-monoxide dehydrogenase medium subunit